MPKRTITDRPTSLVVGHSVGPAHDHHGRRFGAGSVQGVMSFLLPAVFLFFGPSFPPVVGLYLLLLVAGVLRLGKAAIPLIPVMGVLTAAGLEMVFRHRADGDPLLLTLLTPTAFMAALVAANFSEFHSRGRRHFLWGNALVVGLIGLQRLLGTYLVPTYYEFSPTRSVGPGIPDANVFALIHLAFLFPLMVARDLRRGERVTLILLLLTIPIYSMSRTAVLAVVVLFALGYPRSLKSGVRGLAPRLVVWMLLAAGAYLGDAVVGDMEGRVDMGGSLNTRFVYAGLGAATIMEEFTPWGIQTKEHLKVHGFDHDPPPTYHNTYISLIAAAGVFGILGLVFIWGCVYWRYRGLDFVAAAVVLNALFLTTGYLVGVGYAIMLGANADR